ncbi:MAG: hypothetical protein HW403_1515, partial [Dehalococcoidia bacterium]|nr:hypothetical protein [Dehalococcoidia bacterium]
DMLAVPLLDIYCSMTAALDHNYSLRAPSGSDAIDIPILATVLPHCDLVTTDTFMAEIVNQLHLDKKYTVQVLSASAQDRSALLQWVGRLVPSVH